MKEAGVITKEAGTIAKSVSTVVLLKAAKYPFMVLYVMLIPRVMGPESYGEYALLISIITIIASLTDLGVVEVYGRFVPEFETRGELANIKKLCFQTLALKTTISLFTSVPLLLILYFTYGDRFPFVYFLIILVIMIMRDWESVPHALLFGLSELGKYTSLLPISRALSLIFTLILFHYYGLLGALLSTLLVDVFMTLLGFFWTRKYIRLERFRVDLPFLKPYLKFGFMFYISWSLLTVWQRLGNPLIESITENAREVALFDMPNQIFLITATFNLFVISSLVPIFTKLLLTGKEEKLINWSTLMIKYMGIFCSITFGAFVLAGSDLIPLIIGSEYRDIFSNGVVLLLGVFPMIFAQLGSVFAIVYKEPLKYFRALCFAFLTFLGSSALLIPRYASLGCAMATCMSCVVLAVVMCAYFREKLFPCLTDGFKVIALGFVFAPFLFFRGSFITNLFLVVGFVLAYIFLLFAGRILSFREISGIFQALGHQPEKLQSYTPQPVDLAARE